MKHKKKTSRGPLARRVRSKAYTAPMGGAGPHRDRKNDYRRTRKIRDIPQGPSSQDSSFYVFPNSLPGCPGEPD